MAGFNQINIQNLKFIFRFKVLLDAHNDSRLNLLGSYHVTQKSDVSTRLAYFSNTNSLVKRADSKDDIVVH